MIDRTFYENLGALQSGVLLPTCDIVASLAKMEPEAARKAMRKWRKLKKKAIKARTKYGFPTNLPSSHTRFWTRKLLAQIGEDIIAGKDDKKPKE